MPGFTTHYLFGLNTWKQLDAISLKKIIQENHAAYSLGLQGPDLFFYFLPSYIIHKNNIGSIAHTKDTNEFLRHLLGSRRLFSNKRKQQAAEAYIAGFLGHYLLDTHCHPYVYWKTRFKDKSNQYYGRHMSLETDIDTKLLEFYKHCPPSAFRQDTVIRLTRMQLHVITFILYEAYKKTYPSLNIHRLTIRTSIRSMQLGTKFLHDPSGKKKSIISALETFFLGHPLLSTMIPSDTLSFHADPLNLLHDTWENPWDSSLVSNASFLERMDDAREAYLEILTDLNELFTKMPETSGEKLCRDKLLKRLGNNSYHSGLDAGIPS